MLDLQNVWIAVLNLLKIPYPYVCIIQLVYQSGNFSCVRLGTQFVTNWSFEIDSSVYSEDAYIF